MIWVLNINNVIYLFVSLFGESVMCLQGINFTDKNENKFKQKRVSKYPSYLAVHVVLLATPCFTYIKYSYCAALVRSNEYCPPPPSNEVSSNNLSSDYDQSVKVFMLNKIGLNFQGATRKKCSK